MTGTQKRHPQSVSETLDELITENVSLREDVFQLRQALDDAAKWYGVMVSDDWPGPRDPNWVDKARLLVVRNAD